MEEKINIKKLFSDYYDNNQNEYEPINIDWGIDVGEEIIKDTIENKEI